MSNLFNVLAVTIVEIIDSWNWLTSAFLPVSKGKRYSEYCDFGYETFKPLLLLQSISRSGYLFNDNGEFDYALWTCDDVNECKEGFDECSSDEFCQNTDGSYWCMCEDGFWLDPDGKCSNYDKWKYRVHEIRAF